MATAYWTGNSRLLPSNSFYVIYTYLDYDMTRTKLRYVKIKFDTSTFYRVSKDEAAKFVDILSAIGGTMGLLTGFSIISGVEILYFGAKIIINYLRKLKNDLN